MGPPGAHQPAQRTPCVLIAGGSSVVRARLAGDVDGGGLAALETAPGDDLVAVAADTDPAVVVVDATGDDGIDAIVRLRRDPALRHVPVVAVVARGAGLPDGADDAVSWPYEPAELIARLHAAVRTAEARAEARRRTADLAAFAQRTGHDVKSPLTVMVGTAQTLARRWDELAPEKRAAMLESLASGAQRAASLVTDMVALASAGADAVTRPFASADARQMAEIVVQTAGVAEQVTIGGDWTHVRMTPDSLADVLNRLVANAASHGRSGDGSLDVVLHGRRHDGRLTITVADHGAGTVPDDLERLFEPFSPGVGLAVVRRTVEAWGGSVRLERGPGSGTTAVVELAAAG